VTEGYKKTLKLVGTGYRVQAQGAGVSLAVGYSHPVEVKALQGVSIKVEGNDTIHLEGIDKQLVGQMAADIRKIRPPEPYKGKGIKYEDEVVIRKQGKAAA
jgi:large subunit ribosomal protein L6